VAFAKSKSNAISKLDGTFKMPTSATAAPTAEGTELQQSIFNAPPAASAGKETEAPKGVKRTRDEEDEPMEDEDDDEGSAMEESDDD
jgi:U2 small nuclear ribonucleoprotein B''